VGGAHIIGVVALSALGLEDLGALLDVARGDGHLRRETTDQLVHTWPPIRKHGSALYSCLRTARAPRGSFHDESDEGRGKLLDKSGALQEGAHVRLGDRHLLFRM
jgi:hypothetical protein